MRRHTRLAALLSATALVVPAAAQQASTYVVPENVAAAPAPEQPLPFSHKTHLASGLMCMNCHSNPDPGARMGFPATSDCVVCHSAVATDKAAIKQLLSYEESGEDIPWVRVYKIASHVTWSHRTHIDAGMQCETCHGDVRETEVMAESKATRAMATCIGCHQAHDAAVECVSCHAWPTDELLGIESNPD